MTFPLIDDIIYEVSEYIPRGSWKYFIFTCKTFYKFNSLTHVRKYANHTLTIMKHFPNSDWRTIAHKRLYNGETTPEIVESNPNFPWRKEWKSYNIHVSPEEAVATDGRGNIDIALFYKNITVDSIKNHDFSQFPFYALISNKNVSIDIVTTFPECFENWWDFMSENVQPIEEILNHKSLKWCWNVVSHRSDLTSEMVFSNMDINWKWNCLATRSDIINRNNINDPRIADKLDIIYDNVIQNLDFIPDKWNYDVIDWDRLSSVHGITSEFVLKTKDKPWNWYHLVTHVILTDEIMELLADKDLFNRISLNPTLKPQYLLQYNDKQWWWTYLTTCEIIHVDFIMKHRELPWAMELVGMNPTLSFDHVISNPDIKWDFASFLFHDFSYYK